MLLRFFAFAEIIFAPYLSISACATEAQHINENFPTIDCGAAILDYLEAGTKVGPAISAQKIETAD